jgi:hypothetical protein
VQNIRSGIPADVQVSGMTGCLLELGGGASRPAFAICTLIGQVVSLRGDAELGRRSPWTDGLGIPAGALSSRPLQYPWSVLVGRACRTRVYLESLHFHPFAGGQRP